jgi:hypothetical protein
LPVFAERAGADRAEIQFFVLLGAAILAIKLAFLWIDNVPLFFMGDSGGYLGSALGDHVPPERSFAYGQVFIRSLLWLFGSLRAVVAAQVVSSAGSALLLAAVLRVGFDVSRVTAGLAALAYAVEPLALFYERMLMTDNLATFFMAGFVFVGVAYLRRPRIAPLPWLSVFSTAGIALRTSLLPTVLSCAAVLPLLAPGRFKIRLCHLALLAVLTLAGHAAYWHWFHKQTGWAAGYRGLNGFFLLASWLPLMTPADFPDPALYDRIMSQVHFPLSHRTGQLFSPDGVIGNLVRTQPNRIAADALAMRIALNIGRRDPVGVLRLGWETYLDLWNPQTIVENERQRELDAHLIEHMQKRYGEDVSGHHLLTTPSKAWHAMAVPWYQVVLLSPLLWIAAMLAAPRLWRPMIFVGLVLASQWAVDTLVVTDPVVRYLHPLAWLTLLLVAVLLQSLVRRAARRRPAHRSLTGMTAFQAR